MCLGRPTPETMISLSSSVLAARLWLDAMMDIGVLDEYDQVDNEVREGVEDGLVDEVDREGMEDVLDEGDAHGFVGSPDVARADRIRCPGCVGAVMVVPVEAVRLLEAGG